MNINSLRLNPHGILHMFFAKDIVRAVLTIGWSCRHRYSNSNTNVVTVCGFWYRYWVSPRSVATEFTHRWFEWILAWYEQAAEGIHGMELGQGPTPLVQSESRKSTRGELQRKWRFAWTENTMNIKQTVVLWRLLGDLTIYSGIGIKTRRRYFNWNVNEYKYPFILCENVLVGRYDKHCNKTTSLI